MTIVAIDFGTSNTAIAILERESDLPKTWKFEHISHGFEMTDGEAWLVPSLVYVTEPEEQEQFLFGEQARARHLLQDQASIKSRRLFQGFKRDIVANFRPPAREIDGERYDAEAIAEVFLAELWQRLELQIRLHNIEPTQLVLTAPVGAFESYLNWFDSLAKKLKLPNFQIIDESTAAALGYAITRPNALVLVIDFGGGTLDLSLVRTAPIANDLHNRKITKAEAIAKSDAYIGGIDIDRWIAEHFGRQLPRSHSDQASWLRLLEVSEQIKIKLSIVPEVAETWIDQENTVHKLQLTQMQLSELLEQHQMIDQLREAIDEVLAIALQRGISKAAIEQVLLVGGSCQIVAVQQLIIAYFGKSKVSFDKPFEAVAHGALALGKAIAVEDYLRHSYAIKLWEPYLHQYSFYTLFAKGTKYPCKRDEPLILQAAIANQEEIWLDIGEVADISQAEVAYDRTGKITSSQLLKQSDFRSLAISDINQVNQVNHLNGQLPTEQICMARLNPLGQLGVDRIRIDFEVNERRVLMATVVDLQSDRILVNHQAIAKLE